MWRKQLMATSMLEKRNLRLEHDAGIVNGKQIFKTQSVPDIKSNATDDGLYAVGIAYNALSAKEVVNVKKIDTSAIYG